MYRIVSGIISNIAYLNDCVDTIWHNSVYSKVYNLHTCIMSHRDASLVGSLIFALYYVPSGHLVGGLKTRNSTRNLTRAVPYLSRICNA